MACGCGPLKTGLRVCRRLFLFPPSRPAECVGLRGCRSEFSPPVFWTGDAGNKQMARLALPVEEPDSDFRLYRHHLQEIEHRRLSATQSEVVSRNYLPEANAPVPDNRPLKSVEKQTFRSDRPGF